jgi:hypothetical protein
MWWWSFAVFAAEPVPAPDPGAWVAPGPAELAAAVGELEVRLDRAEAIGRAAERLQNAWASDLAAGDKRPCEDAEERSIAARILMFAPSWRDAAQATRAQGDRVRALLASPTVAPLIDPTTHDRISALEARSGVEVAAWLEFAAWHDRWFAPSARGCAAEVAAAAGLPAQNVAAPGESEPATAIIGLGGGTLCPDGLPADGTVQVVSRPLVCIGKADCTCDPIPVAAGAVLFGRP